QTRDALRAAVEVGSKVSCMLHVTVDEVEKHGEVTGGIEVTPEPPERPDLCLVLGGDGTILKALRVYAGTGVPVFGINFGTVGFLAAAEREEIETGLARAFAGDFEVLRLPGLHAEVDHVRPVALNDVSFIRRPHSRVAELSYRLAGEEVGHVRCDGLAAATPSGPTGHNLANQGPILAWGVKGYVVSYISPHSLTARALVVAPGDVLSVGNAPGREPVDVAIDGAQATTLAPGAALDVRFADAVGRLAPLPGTRFHHRDRQEAGPL